MKGRKGGNVQTTRKVERKLEMARQSSTQEPGLAGPDAAGQAEKQPEETRGGATTLKTTRAESQKRRQDKHDKPLGANQHKQERNSKNSKKHA